MPATAGHTQAPDKMVKIRRTLFTKQLMAETTGANSFQIILPADLMQSDFLISKNGWVVGENGKVLKTTNGGANWSFVTNSGINPDESCRAVFPLDANHVWLSSKASGGEQTPFVQYTPDGGSI